MDTLVLTVDDAQSARRTIDGLKNDGISDDCIRVVTRGHTEEEAEQLHSHQATLLEQSDVENSRKRGVVTGAAIGLAIGFAALTTGGVNLLILPAGLLLGVGLGALSAQLIGVSEVSSAVREARNAVDYGKIAVLVDVQHSQHDQVASRLHQLAPGGSLMEANWTGMTARI